MIRFVAVLLATTLATPLLAANIRSGEHADFSRLVIQFDEATDWELGRSDTGYVMRSAGLGTPMDLTEVFRLIPRTRISRVRHDPSASQFWLDLACDCHADAFELREGRVVIDVKAGAAPDTARFEEPLKSRTIAEKMDAKPPVSEVPSPAPKAEIPPPLPVNLDRDLFRSELVEGLSKAMTQGLISPGFSLEEAAKKPVDEPNPESTASSDPEEEVAPNSVGRTTLTQVELDRLRRFLSDPERNTSQCAKFQDLEFTLDNIDPLSGVRTERARLYDPMGRLSQRSAFDLAIAYLSLGFGAEALEILELVDQQDTRTPAFKAIGAILEQQPITSANPFWGQIECRGGYVIWEVLSRETASRLDEEHLRGIQLHFLELPKQLRRRIGPELGVKLAEAGYVEVAQVIRNSLVRAETNEFAALRSIDASMALEIKETQHGVQHLEELVLQDTADAPTALLRLFDAYSRNGLEPPEKFMALISSYSFELQGTSTGAQLALREIEFLIRAGQLNDALDVMDRFQNSERKLSDQELDLFLDLASETGTEIAFGRFALALANRLEARTASAEVFGAVVTRLIDSGLLEVAETLLDRSSLRDRTVVDELRTRLSDRKTGVLVTLDAG
ncbi:hypothetical protein [Dinoroseobacter sp. S375]|uniref:hypothetical protein n=1 Tax=Dinoroseobacter sp. S375 TaxID=3415136 RepID=UPI003C7A930E